VHINPRSSWYPYRFVLPVLAIEILFVGVPLVIGVYYSLHKADYFQLTNFVGFANYVTVLNSPVVRESLAATAIFSIFSLALTFGVGLALALYLERDTRLHVFTRAVVLVPYTIAMLVGSLLLKWIFSKDAGIMYLALGPLGLPDISVLSDPNSAMAALVYNAVWRDSAFAMILLMAGLKGIDAQLYAAARVDGASAWYRFRRITLPLLRVPILITLIRLLIHFVNVLTFALILTGGGPNNSTQTMGLAMYRMGFVDFRLGPANALAFLVLLFNLVLIFILLRLFRQKRVAL
jgi:multiple sugar transport system permease protein